MPHAIHLFLGRHGLATVAGCKLQHGFYVLLLSHLGGHVFFAHGFYTRVAFVLGCHRAPDGVHFLFAPQWLAMVLGGKLLHHLYFDLLRQHLAPVSLHQGLHLGAVGILAQLYVVQAYLSVGLLAGEMAVLLAVGSNLCQALLE